MVFAICIILSVSSLYPQEADFILSKFLATQVEDKVLIRWTITAGNTCQDTYVERSEDGIAFDRIGLIGGICGSPEASITYDYYDTMPLLNRLNYYRLKLGQYGFTSVKAVKYLRFSEKGFFVAPNPMTDQTSILFDNPDNREHRLTIIDLQGRIVLEKVTNSNIFNIHRQQMPAGIYIYKVSLQEGPLFIGKLMVL